MLFPDVRPYTADVEEIWDRFCEAALNATMLHTRKFLSYHGSRFRDVSALVYDNEALVALIPAAVSPNDDGTVISHPGATYGGLVHQGWLTGNRSVATIDALKSHYAASGFRSLVYKPLPYPYAQLPAQDDLYSLYRCGAVRLRCDLASTIELQRQRQPSSRRLRGARKAARSVILTRDPALRSELWEVIRDNLAREHSAAPVHSLSELELLMDRFPSEIQIRCGMIDGRVEAGIVFFNSSRVWHAQYIAASTVGYEHAALDLVFEDAIREARDTGASYFDFGTSNELRGTVLNDGLYRFKTEFGGGGVAHEHYELELTK